MGPTLKQKGEKPMKLRYTHLTFTLTLMLLSAAASAADDPQIHPFAIAPAGDQFSVIGKTGQFALIHNSTSKRVEFSISSKSFVSTAAALSSNSQWLALGAEDGSILLYDNVPDLWEGRAISLEKLPDFTPVGHDYEVQAVAFSPDGKMLASGAADGSLKLLFLTTSTSKKQSSISLADQPMGGIQAIVFSSDGKTLAVGTENGAITLWDIERQRVKKRYDPHEDSYDVTALAFSEDNKTLAAGTSNSELTLWDVSRHQRITTLEGHDGTVGAINALAFSTDGKLLVSGADDKKVMLWNTETQQKIGEYSQGSTVLSIAFAADGQTLIMGDKGGKIKRPAITDFHISPRAGEQDQVAQQTQPTPRKRSTTSRFDYTTNERGVTKKQTQNNTQRTAKAEKQDSIPSKLYEEITPPKKSRLVHSVAFATSTDKPTYILGQQNYFLLTTAQRQHQSVKLPNLYPGSTVVSAAFSHTLKYALALSAEKGNLLLFYDSLDDKDPMMFYADSRVNVVTYSPNSLILAVGTAKKVSTRNTIDGNLFINQIDIPGIAKSLAFSPNSQILAVGRAHGTIELWDVFEHTRLKPLKPKSNYGAKSLAFSPNGKMLAVGKVITGQIELWNVLSAQRQGSFTNQHHGTVNSVAFSPNGKTLASGAEDGKVLLWDIQTREKIDPIERFKQKHPNFNGTGHGENVKILSVAFSDDGKTLMSGDETGLVLLWDLSTIDIDTGPSTDLIASKEVQEESKSTPQIGGNSNQKNREQEIPTTVGKPEKIKPEITVKHPRNVAEGKKVEMISGTVKGDRNGIQRVTIDNKEIGIALEEAFTYYFQTTVRLEEEGDNTFTITATDNEARTEIKEFIIHRKPSPPIIEVISPQFTETRQDRIEIKVKVTDESGIAEVKCNNMPLRRLSTVSGGGIYSETFVFVLRGQTPFRITARDTKGSDETIEQITITSLADETPADKTPPTIVISEKKREVSEAQTYISGTVKDIDSGIKNATISGIKIGDVKISPDSTGYFRHSVPLNEGDNTFTITATDEQDNPHTETVEIHRTPIPPDIQVRAPSLDRNNAATISTGAFTVTVEVTDESGVQRVKINGTSKGVRRAPDGKTFSTTLNRSNVSEQVTIEATDWLDATDSTSFTVNFQIPQQPIATTTPVDKTNNVSTPVTTRNPTPPSKPASTTSRTTSNTEKEERKPRIQFDNADLAEGLPFKISDDNFHLVIYVFDQSEITGKVKIDNLAMQQTFFASKTEEKRRYETNLPINEGENAFHITVMDEWFNVGNASFKIEKLPTDRVAPTIAFLEADNQPIHSDGVSITVRQQRVHISGSVTDDKSGIDSVTVITVNGEEAEVDHKGEFQIYLPLNNERNPITVTATDTAGNDSRRTFTIHRQMDTEGPTLTINVGTEVLSSTTRSIPVTEERIRIHGNVTDDESGVDRLEINGKRVLIQGDRFEKDILLNYQNNPITVTATDTAGNDNTRTFTIHKQIDTEGPTIIISHVGDQTIHSINDQIRVPEERILIRGSVTDNSEVDSLEIDGQSVWVKPGGSFETDISLNNYGKNPIPVKAIDKAGNSSTQLFTIYQQLDRTGKDFALFFATDGYSGIEDKGGNWRDLKTAITDAEAVAENLRNNYGFEPKVFKNLTKRELLNTLYAYRTNFDGTEYASDSQLLIFFSGHGYYHEEVGYLITTDTDAPIEDPTMESALSHEKLRKEIDRIECQRILVLLDTCQSGTFDPNFKALPEMKSVLQDMPLLEKLKRKLTLEARWCLTAAGAEKVADGTTGRSPFAEAFLEALNSGGGDDSVLILDEVWEKVQASKDNPIYNKIVEAKKKAGEEFEKPNPQKGQFGKDKFDESDFLFFPKIE
jgi:WD40 repeat protein